MPLTVLVTGFGPFPGAPFNPTGALVRGLIRLRRPAFADVIRIGHVFATRYESVDREFPALLARHRPDVVLMFGLAARTPYLRIETCARNARSAIFPDAAGDLPPSRTILAGSERRRRGRAPFTRMLMAVAATGLPVRLSHNAGRYLCNYVYWRALDSLEADAPAVTAFIHVPKLRRSPARRGPARGMTANDLTRAAEAFLRVAIATAKCRPRQAQARKAA
jgi:pyroglutamyl-peptidase